MRSIWVIAAVAVSSFLAMLVSVSRPAQSSVATMPAVVPVPTSWCAEGLEAIDDDACFAAPAEPPSPAPLLVYLHGRYGDPRGELDRQARLARLATERGFAVLAFRGKRGECTSPGFESWFCWPSNEHNEGDAPAFVARFQPAMRRAHDRIGPGPDVLLGFSNGGYFASLIATRSLARFDAVVVAHGGPVPWSEAADAGSAPRPPMLLITSEDAAAPEMRKLDRLLTGASWPHALVAREGGHSLPDWDMNMAVTFFERVLGQGFPFEPPLASRVAVAAGQ
jgi:poly(3-hydroxybutyrate) depolymerase